MKIELGENCPVYGHRWAIRRNVNKEIKVWMHLGPITIVLATGRYPNNGVDYPLSKITGGRLYIMK